MRLVVLIVLVLVLVLILGLVVLLVVGLVLVLLVLVVLVVVLLLLLGPAAELWSIRGLLGSRRRSRISRTRNSWGRAHQGLLLLLLLLLLLWVVVVAAILLLRLLPSMHGPRTCSLHASRSGSCRRWQRPLPGARGRPRSWSRRLRSHRPGPPSRRSS